MKMSGFALALLLVPAALPAQAPAPAKDAAPAAAGLLVVDVHPSPYRSTIYYNINIGHGRFDMRDATILDMLAFAFNREQDAILGGPTWIDFDRFDVVAKVDSMKPAVLTASQDNSQSPPPNPYDAIRPVLKRILAERFHLAYHTEDRPLPGYIVTVAKDGAKLTAAKNPDAPNTCKSDQDKATPGQAVLTCTSETIAQLISSFGGVYPHPVIDRTGLTKKYDFTLKLVFQNLRTRDDYIRLYTDAFRQQLGLVVAPGTVSQPAIVVDKVDHTPTPNPPETARLIPAMPDLEFEVASIRPAAEKEPQGQIRPAGSQITLSSFSIQQLLVEAWQLPTGAMLGNAPSWLDHVRYTILVKLPPEIDGRAVFEDRDLFDHMLQKLLVDRFQIKYHWGQQTQDGYVLLAAGTPKMKKADPSSRTSCGYGPPEGEKDVRSAPDSPFDREFYCRNVTMAQFADLLQSLAGSEVKNRVPDKTGLAGSYDFTVFYTTGHKMRVDAIAAAAKPSATNAQPGAETATSEPSGALPVEDAFRKQLGLKLERQPLTLPSLVLDHVERTPTDN